jgi:hypothetical protein
MRSRMISKQNPRTTVPPALLKSRKLLQISSRVSLLTFKLLAFSEISALALLGLVSLSITAQTLPDQIRGYKVHRAEISLHDTGGLSNNRKTSPAGFRLGVPKVVDVSLTGITLEVTVEPARVDAAGTIDFLTFNNFRVNGVLVAIDEYRGPITFKKDQSFSMPHAMNIFISNGGVLEAAWNEFKNSKKTWNVTGQILAFGKFKKMGLKFKRVVTIDVNVSITNPFISSKNAQLLPSS